MTSIRSEVEVRVCCHGVQAREPEPLCPRMRCSDNLVEGFVVMIQGGGGGDGGGEEECGSGQGTQHLASLRRKAGEDVESWEETKPANVVGCHTDTRKSHS